MSMPNARRRYRKNVFKSLSSNKRAGFQCELCQRFLQKYNSQCYQATKRAARKIDPVVVQPLPTADVNCLGAAGVEGMFLGLFLVGGAEVHGLYRRAEKRVQ